MPNSCPIQPTAQVCSGPGQSTCPVSQSCISGVCCATCPDGTLPRQACFGLVCPTGLSCQNGYCCPIPLPTCPNGQRASQQCTGTGQANCPANMVCLNGGCCVMTCTDGTPFSQICIVSNYTKNKLLILSTLLLTFDK